MMAISPAAQAAQAVLDAYGNAPDLQRNYNVDELERVCVAAAVQEAANQAKPETHIEDIDYAHQLYVDGWRDALETILSIAAELRK
jgi:hypothetical protein